MKFLLKHTTILDPQSPYHQQIKDVLIEDGIITQIKDQVTVDDSTKILTKKNLHVSPGWFDMSVTFGEPGFEERETLEHGLKVASKSGFTGIALQPLTSPAIDNKAMIHYVKEKAKTSSTSLYPIGNLTKNGNSEELAELFDMHSAGAVAYGDYKRSLQNSNVIKLALQYVQNFDGLLMLFSQDKDIKGHGVVNEGINATKLGLKGIPALAEALQVARQLYILEYTGGKLHIPTISTLESVELIKNAKEKGLNVTCSVAVHHLVLNDSTLNSFDTAYKILPPLRDEITRKGLVEAVVSGVIDVIASDHMPLDIEHKRLEFDAASFGTIGLESAFSALVPILPLEIIIDKFLAARKLLKIENPSIQIGSVANLTFFETEIESTFTKDNIISKSKNSAFLGQKTKGNVIGIFNNNQLILND